MTEQLYTCKGKGGTYRKVAVADPAGTAKGCERIVTYVDAWTGAAFWRFESDFNARMELIPHKVKRLA